LTALGAILSRSVTMLECLRRARDNQQFADSPDVRHARFRAGMSHTCERPVSMLTRDFVA